MNRLILLLVALVPSLAFGGYPHGYKLTHDSKGNPYKGGYYRYNSYSYKFDWYPAPSYNTNSVSYSYTYNYNNAAANAGATQGGLQGVFRYDELNVGGLQYDSQKYVSAARSIDERVIESDSRRQVQAAYTRDKVHSILATGQANAQVLQAAEATAIAQMRQEFSSSYQSNGRVYGAQQQQQTSQYPMLTQFCFRCHGVDKQRPDGDFYMGDHETAAAGMKAKFHAIVTLTRTGKMPKNGPMPNEAEIKQIFDEVDSIIQKHDYAAGAPRPQVQPQYQREPSNDQPPHPPTPQEGTGGK